MTLNKGKRIFLMFARIYYPGGIAIHLDKALHAYDTLARLRTCKLVPCMVPCARVDSPFSAAPDRRII